MGARRTLHRSWIPVLVFTFLLVPVGCDLGVSSRKPAAPKSDASASASATRAAPDGVARRPVRQKPVPCPSERTGSSTMHDIATVSRGVEVGPLDVVVSRTGKATLAWTAAPGGFDYYRPHI